MKLIRERSSADRQEALNLAFLALRNKDGANGEDANIVDTRDIRKAFTLLRPHYNDAKVRGKSGNMFSTIMNMFLIWKLISVFL